MFNQRFYGSKVFLGITILLTFFLPMTTDMYLPALGQICEDLNTNESTLNVTLYGFMFVMAISILLFGPLIDKFGRKRPLLICEAEYVAATFCCAFVGDVYSLIVLRLMQAMGIGGMLTISTALIKDSFFGTDLAKALNIMIITGVMGPISAPLIGGFVADLWDWRMTFIVPAVFAVMFGAVCTFIDETVPPEMRVKGGVKKAFSAMWRISRNRPFMYFMVMTCCFNTLFMAYMSVSSYVYQGEFGFSSRDYSWMLAAGNVVNISLVALMLRVASHVSNKKMLPVFFCMGLIGSLLVMTIGPSSWYLFFISILCVMVASYTMRPWGMNIMMVSHKDDNGTVSAMIDFTYFMAGTIGMVIATLPWGNHFLGLGLIGLLATAVYAVMYFRVKGSKVLETVSTKIIAGSGFDDNSVADQVTSVTDSRI